MYESNLFIYSYKADPFSMGKRYTHEECIYFIIHYSFKEKDPTDSFSLAGRS
jgi:hypothetical protein